MSRELIINADDFGLSPGVNRGIVEAFREGVLTSTTAMVNMRYFDEAMALAQQNPGLGVGVHLSLLWGRPISDPAAVPTLVEPDGCFPSSLSTLARRYFTGRLSPDQVRLELQNQARRFLESGVRPTHFDTHKHIHCLPGVMRCMIEVAGEIGVERIRLPVERPTPGTPSATWQARAKRDLIRWLCRDSRARLEQAGIRTTDHFIGIQHQACLNSDVLYLILDNLPGGVTEIMCHAGYVDEPMKEFSRIPPYREVELEGLKDRRIRELVAERSIRLMHYGEL